MKRTIVITFIAIVTASSLLHAADFERDLKQLKEDRDKALAAANEPINRRYQAALEQLLRRATQSNDLQTAIKTKEELANLAATTSSTGAPRPRANLRSFLPGTTWTDANKPDGASDATLTFGKDGLVTFSGGGTPRKWEVTDRNTVLINGSGYAVFDEERTSWAMKDKGKYGKLKP